MIKNTAKWRNSIRDNLHLNSNTNSTNNFYKEQNISYSFNDVTSCIMITIQ